MPICDQQENISLKITTKSIDFLLNNFDDFVDFSLTIENFEFELKKQENDTFFTNIFLPNIEIDRNEKSKFSIQLKDEIQIYYSLFNIKTIKTLLGIILSFKQQNDENKEEKQNDLNSEIKIHKINVYLFQNEPILIKINAIPSKINYSFNNGNHDIIIDLKIEMEAFYHEVFNLSNKFDIVLSIENTHKISYKISDFRFDLLKREIKKSLIKIIFPSLVIKRKENDDYDVDSNEKVLIYYSLFDTNSIIDLIIEIKDLISNEFLEKDENKIENQEIISTLLNLPLKFYLKIKSIDLFFIKFNLPLLLLNSNSIQFQYQINQQIQMALKFKLEHLCHQNYDIINPFSLSINYSKNILNIIISPIQTTITSFLIHQILSPEVNDSLYLELDNDCEKIYVKNETGSDVKIYLTPKGSENPEKFIKIKTNSQKYIKKQEYNPEIEVVINYTNYNFSIYDLYMPIFLNKNIVVSLKSINGIKIICFSSPFLIHNKLSYGIEVNINDNIYFEIKSMNKKFIPINANFSLSKQIKASMFPSHNDFCILDFKNTDPIIFHDNDKKVNNEIMDSKFLDYYSTYYLIFSHQSSTCSIIFEPYITITNYLPFNLSFTIEDIVVLQLEQNKPADISFLYNNKGNEFNFILDFQNFAIGNKVISKKKIDNFEEEVCLFNGNQKIAKILFRCSKQKIGKKEIFKISIFSHLVLINDTPIPLNLKESDRYSYQFIDKTIFYSSKSLFNNSCFIKLPICSQNLTEVNSLDFEYVGSFSQVIPLKFESHENIYLLISLKKYLGNYIDSSEIRIRAYLSINNEINHTVFFVPTNQNKKNYFKNTCPERSRTIILGSNKDALFDIYIDGYQHCKNFNFFTLGCSVIRLVNINDPNTYVLLKLTVKKDDDSNCYSCNISSPELRSHICIKNNLSNKDIFIHQHIQEKFEGFQYHPMIIHPNEEIIFAKEQPFIESELKSPYNFIVSFGNEDIVYPVKFDEDYQLVEIEKSHYYYSVKRKNFDDLNIVFTELLTSKPDRTNSEKISQDKTINYSINVTEFQLSYIDKEIHELYLIGIKKALLNINNKIIFSVDGFTLNDMYLASLSPVVIHGKKTPFLQLEIDSKYPISNCIFDNITLKLSPIRVYVDFLFVGDLIASLKEIVILLSNLQNNKKNKINIFYKVFSANSISIDKIILDLYPNGLQDRKYRFKHPDYYNIYSLKIPFFKEVNYTFLKIKKYNVEAPVIDFLKSLFEDYKNQISFEKVFPNILTNLIQLKQICSNSFENFLEYKSTPKYNDDSIMQYPRRIPRAFPKRKIINVPINFYNIEYPDVYSDVQYFIQKISIDYRNENLHEIFESNDNLKLAICDNYAFIIYKPNSKKKLFEIEYKKITTVKNDSNKVSFISDDKKKVFECRSEQDAQAIVKRVNSFILKIKISEQAV